MEELTTKQWNEGVIRTNVGKEISAAVYKILDHYSCRNTMGVVQELEIRAMISGMLFDMWSKSKSSGDSTIFNYDCSTINIEFTDHAISASFRYAVFEDEKMTESNHLVLRMKPGQREELLRKINELSDELDQRKRSQIAVDSELCDSIQKAVAFNRAMKGI